MNDKQAVSSSDQLLVGHPHKFPSCKPPSQRGKGRDVESAGLLGAAVLSRKGWDSESGLGSQVGGGYL